MSKAKQVKPLRKTEQANWKKDKEEEINWQEIPKDDRVKKIAGFIFLLISLTLFFSSVSYFFTWQDDQTIAAGGFAALGDSSEQANNWLGRMGAVISHNLIYRGFGIASLLVSTFFFVVGINLLMRRKVYSISRNLKYVTLGMLLLSVTLAFVFSGNVFPWGGEVGKMISEKLTESIGWLGTAACLLFILIAYVVWQFNPSMKKKVSPSEATPSTEEMPEEKVDEVIVQSTKEEEAPTIEVQKPKKRAEENGNGMHVEGTLRGTLAEELTHKHNLTIVERQVDEEVRDEIRLDEEMEAMEIAPEVQKPAPIEASETVWEPPIVHVSKPNPPKPIPILHEEMPLEINTAASVVSLPIEPEQTGGNTSTAYEPTLDLRDYKYPTLDLLETHGSEQIVQDPEELEKNKDQIIETLRNYSIEIQKISATIGPTVTLYEIVPAAGVRISRIKNLEDDIALSLAALGIRIIAPIPGKGTIGIEVPNAKKTIVSMKALLSSEKFQQSKFSLPIALGKTIDNQNFIVDLASMPHLLMAGATGQGKSVGLNAILVSLIRRK